MTKEKESGNLRWFSENNLKMRVKELGDGKLTVWIAIDNANITLTMLIYDFLDWCTGELSIFLEVDISWNNQRGFIINKTDEIIFLNEVKKFILTYQISVDKDDYVFTDDEWYSS